MKAIGNYILVERIDAKNKEVNGLLYTEKLDVDNRYIKGKVISCGDNVAVLKKDDVIGDNFTFAKWRYKHLNKSVFARVIQHQAGILKRKTSDVVESLD